jgi:hypothetical protein
MRGVSQMKKLAFGALFVGLLVACGGDGNKIMIKDSGGPDAPMVCNPLTQAGCMAGEKCTWLLDALMPQYVGHIGCAPDGTAAIGDACMYGAPGTTGYDNCAKGGVCGNYRGGAGTCKKVCDQQGGNPTCGETHVCVTYSGLFSTGETSPAAGGVCDLACDPLADNDFDGSGTASNKTATTCGTGATAGCYGWPSYGTPPVTGWSCTNDIHSDVLQDEGGLRHRVECTVENRCADPGPKIYINSCNQGYLPLIYEASGAMKVVCAAMCEPQPCYKDNCGAGTPPANRFGKEPHRCTGQDRLPAEKFNAGTANHEHCQYLWYREIDENDDFLPSKTSDTLGFCLDMKKYQYDSNSDQKLDANDKYLPDCDQLVQGFGNRTMRDVPEAYFGAGDLGCVPTTQLPTANGKVQLPPDFSKIRALTNLPRPLYNRMKRD